MLWMFVDVFLTEVLIEEQNVFHLWLSQKVQSNFEKQRVHKLLLSRIWFSLGWLNHGPQKHMCC